MNSREFAIGMAKVAETMAEERSRCLKTVTCLTDRLASIHGKAFVAYLEAYGITDFEDDLVDRYQQLVLTRRFSMDSFEQWVVDRYRANDRLTHALPRRGRAASNPATPSTFDALTFDDDEDTEDGGYYYF